MNILNQSIKSLFCFNRKTVVACECYLCIYAIIINQKKKQQCRSFSTNWLHTFRSTQKFCLKNQNYQSEQLLHKIRIKINNNNTNNFNNDALIRWKLEIDSFIENLRSATFKSQWNMYVKECRMDVIVAKKTKWKLNVRNWNWIMTNTNVNDDENVWESSEISKYSQFPQCLSHRNNFRWKIKNYIKKAEICLDIAYYSLVLDIHVISMHSTILVNSHHSESTHFESLNFQVYPKQHNKTSLYLSITFVSHHTCQTSIQFRIY